MQLDLPHTDHGPRDAPALILLHGFPLDHAMWGPVERALVASGLRVLAPDLRGFGKAPSASGVGSVSAHAGDVLRLADRAGLRRFVLVGFSFGGYVALEVARQSPGRLLGLVLVDTRMEPDSEEARKGRAATIAKVRETGVGTLVDAMLSKMISEPAQHPEVEAMMRRQGAEGMVHALEAMAARPDSTPTLRALDAPVLVVVGEHDPITPPDAARAMAASAKRATLVVVPGLHLTPVASPDDVAQAIVAWMPPR